jgi:ABC-type transporter Mla subunit MlaD
MIRVAMILALAGSLAGCAKDATPIVHVRAKAAPGLKAGAKVQYRGIEVGTVKAIYFTDDGVQIDLSITRQDAPIRAQDTVRIVPTGAFGDQLVAITPGSQDAPLIRREGSLPTAAPDSAPMTESVLRAMRNAIDGVIAADSANTARRRRLVTRRDSAPASRPD